MTAVANDRLMFIHIPKTGGTWVSEAMEAAGVDLERIGDGTQHPEKHELDIGDRYAFAFVREPVSWYWSIWKFHRRNPLTHWPNINKWVDRDFTDFLEQMAENCPGYLAGFYAVFVGPPDDQINFIGRYERLGEDLVTALRSAGQSFDEEILRAMPARNFDEEETQYGSMPSGRVPEIPAQVRAALVESEREIYERFYGGAEAVLGAGATVRPGGTGSDAVQYGKRIARERKYAGSAELAPDPIVVYGAPRSGTTYLEQILNAHPSVFISHETRVFAWLHHAFGLTHDDRLVANQREGFVEYLRAAFPQMIRDFYRGLAPENVRYWGDKNPHYADPFNDGCLETVADLFPSSRFIHIIRDGRDVVSSLMRKQDADKPWVTFDQAHFTWSRHVERGSTFGRTLPADRYFEIRYEDLVTNDGVIAGEIFGFLGIEPHPAVEAFCASQQEQRTPFKGPTRDLEKGVTASDWATIFSPEEQARSLQLIGSHLIRYGYATEDSLARLRERTAEDMVSPDRAAPATSATPAEG